MRIYLTAAILLGLLAGCSSDQASSDNKATAAASSVVHQNATWPVSASPISSFASMPDRGELLAYEQGRKVKRSGAYTGYPVSLSEAHALHAMQTGEMVVKAPNGELLHLKYESHVEHPDGNWSWIGRNAAGASAVLTFGEKAVFGTIPQGASDTLRLTVSGGQSWLVQTDRSKLSGLDGAARRDGTDQLIPPKLAVGSGAMSVASMRAESAGAVGPTAATAVVDVLLGYTNGFATKLGGPSQANTRLNNLIVITNQAYVNSGVSMRVRLVKTLQVNYADNTDNGDALEKLTGYKAGTGGGPITPDPAFSALRTARDESGADLVSLVRTFRTPENNGCGIAWLIGGGQSGIEQADAPFGYSVVSDGTDLDEGDQKTYFCREETLAHELGHNMGQAHNDEDSDTTGVHAYSYGYREASTSGFYTVMAYPVKDGKQFSIPYFANPAIAYSGRATGVANAADNVRSMNLTMPVVSAFRATVVPIDTGKVRNDVNGDGKTDLLWSNPSQSLFVYWTMNGATISSTSAFSIDGSYAAIGTGDLDGNGRVDIIWKNAAGQIYAWMGNANGGFTTQYIYALNANWKLVGTGDVNGDGKADLLWSNTGESLFVYWTMNGATISATSAFSIDGAYSAIGTGDLDGNGRVDIIWKNAAGQIYAWMGNANGGFTTQYMYALNSSWKLVGVGDVNGDGKADLLWSNPGESLFVYWRMNGATISSTSAFYIDGAYAAIGTGDLDGNGRVDIIWRNAAGHTYAWLGNAAGGFDVQFIFTLQTSWSLLPG